MVRPGATYGGSTVHSHQRVPADLKLPANPLLNAGGSLQEEDGEDKSIDTLEVAMQRTTVLQAILNTAYALYLGAAKSAAALRGPELRVGACNSPILGTLHPTR